MFVAFVVYRTPIRGVFVVVGGDSVIGDGVRYVGSVVSVPSVPGGIVSVLFEVGWGVWGGAADGSGEVGGVVSWGGFGSERGSSLGCQSPKFSLINAAVSCSSILAKDGNHFT